MGGENLHYNKVYQVIEKLKKSKIKNNITLNCTYTKLHSRYIKYNELVKYFDNIGLKYSISNVITDNAELKIKKDNDKISKVNDHIIKSYKNILLKNNNIEISIYVKSILEAMIYGISADNYFCYEANGKFVKVFDTDGNEHPCISLIKFSYYDEYVKKINLKNNEQCRQCWVKKICRNCIVPYLIRNERQAFEFKECRLKSYYSFALEKLIEIYDNSEDEFKLLFENYSSYFV